MGRKTDFLHLQCAIFYRPDFKSAVLSGGVAAIIRDLKHHDGSHDDGIPEANFLFRSCAETE